MYFATGMLLGGAMASNSAQRDRRYRDQTYNLQAQTLQAQAEARAARAQLLQQQQQQQYQHQQQQFISPPPSSSSSSSMVQVRIPEGAYAGGEMQVVDPRNQQPMLVTVPAGYGPGMVLTVQLPVQPQQAVAVYGKELLRECLSAAPTAPTPAQPMPNELVLTRDHVVDESLPENQVHGILSLRRGDRVQLVEGDLKTGLPPPYGDYVLVITLDGEDRVGRVSKFCLQ